jgi:predicted component of type VI protein secretion system
MAELVEPLDFALRNTRVVARRVAVAAYRHEPIPTGYAVFLRDLADVTDAMALELRADRMAEITRDSLIRLGRASSRLERTTALSADVVLASVRSLIADLLAVSGMDPLAATDEIPPLPEA